jgi:hypothetical protein
MHPTTPIKASKAVLCIAKSPSEKPPEWEMMTYIVAI